MLDHTGHGGKAGGEPRRVVQRAGVVGDDAPVGARRDVSQRRGRDVSKRRFEPEREELERDGRRERLDGLARIRDHDEAVGGGGHDLLPRVGGASSLDDPAGRVDLIGTVDRDVELVELPERHDVQAELPSLLLGSHRRGDAEDVEAATRERRQEVGDRRPGAEADRHPVFDQLSRRFGRGPPLVLDVHARDDTTSKAPSPSTTLRVERQADTVPETAEQSRTNQGGAGMSTEVKATTGRFVWHDHMSSDPDEARAFYSELLGWEVEVWKPGEMDYPMIKANGQTHGGFGPAQGGAPSHWLGHVEVDDVDRAVARAEKAGGNLLAPAMDIPEVGRMAVIADPQGAVFSVFAPATESPTSEGTFLWDELMTADVEASKRFYTEVVGWTTGEMDMGEAGVYTLFKRTPDDNGAAGCLEKPPDMPVAAWITYVGTDDVDDTATRAEQLGGHKIRDPFDVSGVGRIAILADRTGAVFGIFKPSEPAS